MNSHWSKTLHHKTLARSIGAIAGLAGALSVLVGSLAAHMAPHGWSTVKVALHLARKPLLLKLAPFIAGFAVTAATAAGLLSFYSWCRSHAEDEHKKSIEDDSAQPSPLARVSASALTPQNDLNGLHQNRQIEE